MDSGTITKSIVQAVFMCSMASYAIALLALVLFHQPSIVSSQSTVSSFETCTANMQEEAYTKSLELRCEPRDQIIKLDLPNATYFNMMPDQVVVKRCGGTCSVRRYATVLLNRVVRYNIE